MEASHDLGLALCNVEGRAVRFGNTRDEVHDEEREQRNHEPLGQAAGLCSDDLAEIQAAAGHQDADQRKAHGDFVSDDLRRRAHRTEKRVL